MLVGIEHNRNTRVEKWMTTLAQKFNEAGQNTFLNSSWAKIPPCDVFIVWNGQAKNVWEAVQSLLCRGTRVITCEHGWFPQADHFYFDGAGANYLSTIASMKFTQPDEKGLDALCTWLYKYHNRRPVGIPYKPGFIFLPLQLEYDAQITKASNFSTMQEVVNLVTTGFPNDLIVVKPHPLNAEAIVSTQGNMVVAPVDTNLHQLIKDSKVVVTVNSTVGAEALSYAKPVIALGLSFYTHDGIVLSGQTSTLFYESVNAIRDGWQPDRLLLQCMFYELVRRQWKIQDLQGEKNIGRILNGDFYAWGSSAS